MNKETPNKDVLLVQQAISSIPIRKHSQTSILNKLRWSFNEVQLSEALWWEKGFVPKKTFEHMCAYVSWWSDA